MEGKKYWIVEGRNFDTHWTTQTNRVSFKSDDLWKFMDAYHEHKLKLLGIANVSSYLSIEEVASKYGQKLKCKWLSPDGNDWLDKEMTVNASFLKEMEQGSIKDCR